MAAAPRALHSSAQRQDETSGQTSQATPPSLPEWAQEMKPLEDRMWRSKLDPVLSRWGMSERIAEEIVQKASWEKSRDEDILQLLENLPVDPAHAANILAWTMPGVHWSRGKLGHSVSAFLTARVRLLRIAHEHAKDITYAKATRLGLARSLSLRYKWRKEALKIVEEAIKDGDVSAYAAKAFCLKMGWRQTRDPTTKKRLASQRVDALEQGMEQGDCQCAKELASLLVQGRIVAKDETRAKKCLERAVATAEGASPWALLSLAHVIRPRSPSTPWIANPYGDAVNCLKFSTATAKLSTPSRCRLGLFYYRRPNLTREEHVEIWTTEPDDVEATKHFRLAMQHHSAQANRLYAEMLIWDRVKVPEVGDQPVAADEPSSEGAAMPDETGEVVSESSPATGITSDSAMEEMMLDDPEEEDEAEEEGSDDARIDELVEINLAVPRTRREQLVLARDLLKPVMMSFAGQWTFEQRLYLLAKRLLKEIDEGGEGLPGPEDLKIFTPAESTGLPGAPELPEA